MSIEQISGERQSPEQCRASIQYRPAALLSSCSLSTIFVAAYSRSFQTPFNHHTLGKLRPEYAPFLNQSYRVKMGSLGPVAFKVDEEQPFLGYEIFQGRDYGETTADRIDQDVQGLLGERYETVCKLLTSKRQQLDRLAEALLHNETIDEVTIEQVLGARVKDTTGTK